MSWQLLAPGAGGAADPRCADPYWRWACLTGWRSFVGAPGDPVAIIGELADGAVLADLLAQSPFLQVPPVYQGTPHRHFTARLPRERLAELSGLSAIRRWELGAALRSPRGGPGDGDLTSPPAPAERPPPLAGPVMAVIDDDLAFLHPAFAGDDGAPRVRRLWDQGRAATGAPWSACAGLGYGREWVDTPANAALAAAVRDEAAAYRRWDLLHAPAGAGSAPRLWRWTHGTPVLHVAAGHPDPLAAPAASAAGAERDAAARADLLYVALPKATAVDASAGSLQVHVLDALRWVLDRVAPDAPLVVNLSYGCQAGPHDGSSLLECALDELMALRPRNFAIVLGAGNSRALQAHACADVSAAAPWRLDWMLPAGDRTDSFVELWAPADAPLTVAVTPPGGARSMTLAAGESAVLRSAAGEVVAALLYPAAVPNGHGTMVLLALHATAAVDAGQPLAPAGTWTLEVASSAAQPVPVHAWIETEEYDAAAPAAHGHFGASTAEAGTLSGYATGRFSVVAGGLRRHDGTPAAYASLGPPRGGLRQAPSPSALAACEEDEMARGFRVAATLASDSVRMNGTSVAAPVLARQLLNHLAERQAAGLPPVPHDGWQAVVDALAGRPALAHRLLTSAPAAPSAA